MNVSAIPTNVGKALHGEHIFFGYRVFGQLLGTTPFVALASLSVGGPRLSESDCRLLDDTATLCAFADPRVWILKVARISASYGSPLSGVSGALLCADGEFLGPRVVRDACVMLREFSTRQNGNPSEDPVVAELVDEWRATRGRIPGFGVPGREEDERYIHMCERLRLHQRDDGHYVRLAQSVARAMRQKKAAAPNVALAMSGMFLDLAFSPEQAFALMVMLLMPTIVANALEGAQQCAPVLQQLPDEAIRYEGPAPRLSPRAIQAMSK